MEMEEMQISCQIPCVPSVAEGIAQGPPVSPGRWVKLMIRRRLSPARERKLKNRTNGFMNRLYQWAGMDTKPSTPPTTIVSPGFQAGDLVRIRSLTEIKGTLNHWRQLKGCTFMPEMGEYCGTTQKVLKAMQRFVDERDLRVKKSNGIILLEGVMCRGTAEFGPCDRSCLVFWREEWLEKIDKNEIG